jgi:hypothetical protein
MNHQTHTDPHHSYWEPFGELELLLNADQNETIHEWLDRILKPLNLYEDICHRVEVSLQEAATRVLNAHSESGPHHIHLKIYLPRERALKGKNWTFFRVEKMEEHSHDEEISDHAIALYLYLQAH